MKRHLIWRSAVTGRWVSRRFAAENPDTTVAEVVGPIRALIARATMQDPDVTVGETVHEDDQPEQEERT